MPASTTSAPYIHPSAFVEPDVVIGDRTKVWHGAHLRSGAVVGADCVIGGGVFVDTRVILGDRVKVQDRALLYQGSMIEDGVFIGPAAIITNDRHPRAINVDGSPARADDWALTATRVGSGSSIGAGAIIVAGNDIGAFAMVGAGAVVTRPVPDHALVLGNPARMSGWVCHCGETLQGASDRFACAACGSRYRLGSETMAAEG